LRLAPEDKVACFNGDGMEYIYQIHASSARALELLLINAYPNQRDPGHTLKIFIAATKGKTRDRMVRDLPPLGVTEIIFFQAERSIAKLEADQQERLQKIAVEACRQCGRSTIPHIQITDEALDSLLRSYSMHAQTAVVFWENESTQPFANWQEENAPSCLLFGPEGGFSPGEIQTLQRRKIPTSSLGRRILRSELAVSVGVVWWLCRFPEPEPASKKAPE
jgi:16S rRNA (uracil1498-N3)-methyltransferase